MFYAFLSPGCQQQKKGFQTKSLNEVQSNAKKSSDSMCKVDFGNAKIVFEVKTAFFYVVHKTVFDETVQTRNFEENSFSSQNNLKQTFLNPTTAYNQFIGLIHLVLFSVKLFNFNNRYMLNRLCKNSRCKHELKWQSKFHCRSLVVCAENVDSKAIILRNFQPR